MAKNNNQNRWEKEWVKLNKQEEKFTRKALPEKESILNQKLEQVIPPKLRDSMHSAFLKAFHKAFSIVFEKGTAVIEKTYSKEKLENTYKINKYADELYQNQKSLNAFSKQANTSHMKNLLLSGVEGVGLGILGIGLWDVPVFTGVLLKNIYEIALSYGFSYEPEEERYFILKLIQASLAHSSAYEQLNLEVDELIELGISSNDWNGQIEPTVTALIDELLYLKFIQGIPIAGALGGLSDGFYLNKISHYVKLKYHKRFLTAQCKKTNPVL